jgi:hypothetical protein
MTALAFLLFDAHGSDIARHFEASEKLGVTRLASHLRLIHARRLVGMIEFRPLLDQFAPDSLLAVEAILLFLRDGRIAKCHAALLGNSVTDLFHVEVGNVVSAGRGGRGQQQSDQQRFGYNHGQRSPVGNTSVIAWVGAAAAIPLPAEKPIDPLHIAPLWLRPSGWEIAMFVTPLLGAAVFIAVATDPLHDATGETRLSLQEKAAATEPLVRSATQCIVRAVTASRRYRGRVDAQIGDRIVDSMPTCLTPVRAMIDAYDRYYGDGAGEASFMGPYLGVLPTAVAAGASRPAP